jgi:glycopeptide antibiotics resistance protein
LYFFPFFSDRLTPLFELHGFNSFMFANFAALAGCFFAFSARGPRAGGGSGALAFTASLLRLYALAFYTFFILDATLFSRRPFSDPLSELMTGWDLMTPDRYLFYPMVNLVLFTPFTALLLSVRPDLAAGRRGGASFFRTVYVSGVSALIFSLFIETSQLVFNLGTFQYSDLVYNTCSGILGGLCYLPLRALGSLARRRGGARGGERRAAR